MDSISELHKSSAPEQAHSQKVEFIPGDHLDFQHGHIPYDRFKEGYLNAAHDWTHDAVRLIRKVNPGTLIIDGISPSKLIRMSSSDVDEQEKDFSEREKIDIWIDLPASPRELTSSGVVNVIAGDMPYRAASFNGVLDENQREQLDAIFYSKDITESNNKTTAKIIERIAIIVPPLLASYLAIVALPDKQHANDIKTISRRKILKGAAVISAGVGVFGIANAAAYWKSAEAPSLAVSHLEQRILDLGERFSVTNDNFTTGRTGLLYSKYYDAVKQGKIPLGSQSAILMGRAHTPDALRMRDSKKARMNAIHDYASEFIACLDETLPLFSGIPRDKAVNDVLDIFAQADIARVTDPGINFSKDPQGAINENVRYVGYFVSEEVLEAVKDLRPGYVPKKSETPLVF